MTALTALIAAQFLQLTGPDNQVIDVNPAEIVSIRSPRRNDHFAPGTRCIIFTSDGKYQMVQELCTSVEKMLEAK